MIAALAQLVAVAAANLVEGIRSGLATSNRSIAIVACAALAGALLA
jgi:hypothetical protein